MAITATALTINRNSANQSSYSTASILPTAGKFCLVAVVNRGPAASVATLSGCGQTWTQVGHIVWNTFLHITVFKVIVASPSSGAITIDFGADVQLDCAWSVVEFTGLAESPIAQFLTGKTAEPFGAQTLTLTLAAFSHPRNAAVGFFGAEANSNGWAGGSGFTVIHSNSVVSESSVLAEFKSTADTTVDGGSAGGDIALVGIALELNILEENAYLKIGPTLQAVKESYIKTTALMSYPERYLKILPLLEARIEPYMKIAAPLQAEKERYVKFSSLSQAAPEIYMKLALNFPAFPELYLKFAAALVAAPGQQYLRLQVNFAVHASYLKLSVALVKTPILGDLGDDAPANKAGLLSRQYLSLSSVKKEV